LLLRSPGVNDVSDSIQWLRSDYSPSPRSKLKTLTGAARVEIS